MVRKIWVNIASVNKNNEANSHSEYMLKIPCWQTYMDFNMNLSE